ncbi:hypothetical protein QE150_00675 (plasmid) [Acinetobacter baumannii]|uniref:hypothetical protein n=1 Tax=Acinetobacter baumannii TaxID=470 RepID=UPI002482EDB1|nr:hypothetical protein [Acinetobacter baumannii]WGT80186.1 hypothetical protein QE150_00675 [Acinetobacter baumannii]
MFVLLSGTTCSGKTTIADALTEKYGFNRIVTTTSRPKREGEVEGLHYHFITQTEFDALKRLISSLRQINMVIMNMA